MKLHIYNPEHDIALAKNDPFFTPPKAARVTRNTFFYLPAIWAEDGDWVLTDEPIHEIPKGVMSDRMAEVKFVTKEDLRCLTKENMPEEVLPWGWDLLVVNSLLRANPLFASLVPTREKLDDIRRMSSREFVAEHVLPRIVESNECFVGEMTAFRGTVDELETAISSKGPVVLKSPWSCSGRGVKFVDGSLTESERGWIRNILAEQGCVMIEPQYNKVIDFAMEFWAGKSGVEYRGLNVFETRGGAYIRNIDGTQKEKLEILHQYVGSKVIEQLKANVLQITTEIFHNRYEGPLGIDMMIVNYNELKCNGKAKVHPCVEMNLRRTMGHVIF